MGGFLGFHFRRGRQQQSQDRRKSTLNGRYGSSTITCPSDGAYASPSKKSKDGLIAPTATYVERIDNEVDTNLQPRHFNRKRLSIVAKNCIENNGHNQQYDDVLGSASEIPIHPAYLINIPEPASPTTTIASDSTWKGSRPSSPVHTKPPSFKEDRHYNPLSSHPPSISDLSTAKREGSRTRHTRSRSQSRPRSKDRALKQHSSQVQLHDHTSSRIYPPALNTSMGRARSQSRQRSQSRPKNVPRSSSTVSNKRRSTVLVGLGNSNASQQRFDSMKDERRDKQIAVDREHYYDENRSRRYLRYESARKVGMPARAEEGELWPGLY